MKHSSFRTFCREKWYEHKDELLNWTQCLPEYDDAYYFRKHRWMLKALYKITMKDNNGL